MATDASPQLAEAMARGRVFRFTPGLEDVKWGSLPSTIFGLALLIIMLVLLPRAATSQDRFWMVTGPLIYLVMTNIAFLRSWRQPRVVIVTPEALYVKRPLGGDIRLPWSAVTSIKIPWFHLETPGATVTSKSPRYRLIIGEEIEDFDELLQLIQHHVRQHNPSAQFIGLPELPRDWRPEAETTPAKTALPQWLSFEVPA